MPRIDESKESDIKTAIRTAIAMEPMISSYRLQEVLREHGYRSSQGGLIDRHYVLKLVRKIRGEAIRDLSEEKIGERLAGVRERFNVAFERLFKIAFWKWDYLTEGLGQPSVGEQTYALSTILKMDLALLAAEMDAGLYKRTLGLVEHEIRNAPLSDEQKETIRTAFERWGMLKPPVEALPETAPKSP